MAAEEVVVLEMAMDVVRVEIGIEEWAVEIVVEMQDQMEIGDNGRMIITEIVAGVMIVVHGIIRIQAGEVAVDIIRIGQMIALEEVVAINRIIQQVVEMEMDDQCVERISVEITDLHLTATTKVSDLIFR